jgi:predicted transcriptional regulator
MQTACAGVKPRRNELGRDKLGRDKVVSSGALGRYDRAMTLSEPSVLEMDAEAEAAADAEAIADYEAGRTISHQAMRDWLLSWGTSDELPPPAVGT